MSDQREEAVIEMVADGVWVGTPAPGEGAMGAVVTGDTGVVIDTTSYGRFAESFLERVGSSSPGLRWRGLLISHRHFDHFGGAPAIHAPVIAHQLTREAMAAYTQDWLERQVAGWIDQGMIIPELLGELKIVLPEVTYEKRLALHLDAHTDVVMFHTGGHTADESMIYLPRQRVIFGGDNIFHQRAPFTGHGDLVTWIVALERVRTLPIDVVVPGHGPVGGPDVIDQQLDDLRELLRRSLDGEP